MKIKFEKDKLGSLVEGSIEPMQNTGPEMQKQAPPEAAPAVFPRPSKFPPMPRPGKMDQSTGIARRRLVPEVQVIVRVNHAFSKAGVMPLLQIEPGSPSGQIGETYQGGLPMAPFVPAETGRVYLITIVETTASSPSPKPNPFKEGTFA